MLKAASGLCPRMQDRLAPSAVTHRISTLHPYNTRQQPGLAGQQLNKCQIMPGELTPTEINCASCDGVPESCCNHKAAGVRRCSKCQCADADLSRMID